VKGSWDEQVVASHPYFQATIQRFLQGDVRYVQRFLAVWAKTPPGSFKWRFSYPIDWEHPEAGLLRFRVCVNPASHQDSLSFNDWIPLDSASWAGLERLAVMDER
jgi:hypothetical protein